MVEQMVDSKFRGISATSDKQPLAAIKKTALRDLQNDNRTVFPKSSGNFLSPRETDSTGDATQALGAKSPAPNSLLSPPNLQSPGSSNVNQHLVYARRKSDAELIKCSISDRNHSPDNSHSEQFRDKRAIPQPQTKIKEPKSGSILAFEAIPVNSTCGTQVTDSLWKHDRGQLAGVNSAVPCSEEPQVIEDQHWRVRFIQLQKYLRQCDNSNQEACVHMLRSFTPDERSRHAIELEKRAIHLFLEEGREMQRMKALNVLGKSFSNSYPSPPTPKVKPER